MCEKKDYSFELRITLGDLFPFNKSKPSVLDKWEFEFCNNSCEEI